MRKIRILFVCMGNICRSPTAHGVFEKLVRDSGLSRRIAIDSAGTHAYHVGEKPDARSQAAALERGVDLSSQQARRVLASDFEEFDYVLAMDEDNFHNLSNLAPAEHRYKLRLFLDFAPQVKEREVPDPYYGGGQGFERVLDLVEAAARGLLHDIQDRHL